MCVNVSNVSSPKTTIKQHSPRCERESNSFKGVKRRRNPPETRSTFTEGNQVNTFRARRRITHGRRRASWQRHDGTEFQNKTGCYNPDTGSGITALKKNMTEIHKHVSRWIMWREAALSKDCAVAGEKKRCSLSTFFTRCQVKICCHSVSLFLFFISTHPKNRMTSLQLVQLQTDCQRSHCWNSKSLIQVETLVALAWHCYCLCQLCIIRCHCYTRQSTHRKERYDVKCILLRFTNTVVGELNLMQLHNLISWFLSEHLLVLWRLSSCIYPITLLNTGCRGHDTLKKHLISLCQLPIQKKK